MCWSSHDRNYQGRGWYEQRPPVSAQQVDFRVSDAERNNVIDQLKRHTADGRLTLEEFEDRVGEAMRAKTAGELRGVLRELPPFPSRPTAPPRRSGVPVPFLFIGVLLLLTVGWGHPFFWLLIPIGFFWFRGVHRGRRRRFEGRNRAITSV